VVHGAIRDAGTLSTMALGIKALAACPLRSEKRGEGSVEVAVTFAGATIHPGDYIYADLNGILVAREPLSHPQL
jgi:regulator of ribonuclease activity A